MTSAATEAPDRLHLLVVPLGDESVVDMAERIRAALPGAVIQIDRSVLPPPSAPLHPPAPPHPSAPPHQPGSMDLVVLIAAANASVEEVTAGVEHALDHGPVLAVLENGDDDQGLAAMSAGADDWVGADVFNPQALIRRVVLRHRAQEIARTNRVQARMEGETDRLGRMLTGGSTSITARSFGSTALRDALPDLYISALRRFNDLVDRAVEERIYGDGSVLDADLQSLAETLGFARAGPRDVIDLYVTVLRARDASGPAKRRAVMMEESRLLVLQLMGHLANHYRLRVMGAPVRRGEKGTQR